jgi:hypothetical protein
LFKKEDKKGREDQGSAVSSTGAYVGIREERRNKLKKRFDSNFSRTFLTSAYIQLRGDSHLRISSFK